MALILLRIMYESVPGSPLPYCSVSSCGGRARMRLDQGMVRLSGKEGITLVIIAGRGETCRQGGVSPWSVLSRWLFLLRGIQMHPRQHVQERSSFNCLTSLLLFSPWCEQQQWRFGVTWRWSTQWGGRACFLGFKWGLLRSPSPLLQKASSLFLLLNWCRFTYSVSLCGWWVLFGVINS